MTKTAFYSLLGAVMRKRAVADMQAATGAYGSSAGSTALPSGRTAAQTNARYAEIKKMRQQRAMGQRPSYTTAGGMPVTRLTGSTDPTAMQQGVSSRAAMRANLGTMDNYAGQKVNSELSHDDRDIGITHEMQHSVAPDRFMSQSDVDMMQRNKSGYNLMRTGGMSHEDAMAALKRGRVRDSNGNWVSTPEHKKLLQKMYAQSFNTPQGMARSQQVQSRQLAQARNVDATGRQILNSWGQENLGNSYVTPNGVVVVEGGAANSPAAMAAKQREAQRNAMSRASMAQARRSNAAAKQRTVAHNNRLQANRLAMNGSPSLGSRTVML